MKKLKEMLKKRGVLIGFVSIVSIALTAGLFAVSRLIKNSEFYAGKKATHFVIDSLDSDDELLKQSPAMDCYATVYEDVDGISQKMDYIQTGLIKGNGIIIPQIKEVTLEDVKNSIKNISDSIRYLASRINYISFAEEEISKLKSEMVHDYAVIMKYTELHQDEDYSNFLRGTMAKILDNLYQENNIDNIQINTIVPVSNDTVTIEAVVNGKVMNFTIQGQEYRELVSKVLEKNKSTFIGDLQNLNDTLTGTTKINENNMIKKKEQLSNEVIVGVGIIALALFYVSCQSRSKQR